jgi:hypothetical protein
MTRTGMKIGLAAFLAVLLAAPGLRAGEPGPEKSKDDLEKEVAELRKELADLRKAREVDRLALLELRLQMLADRLEKVERAVATMAATTTTRRAAAFNPDDPAPATGSVRLDNRMATTAFVTVNGVTYTVPPFGERTVAGVPAGSFVYQASADGFLYSPPTRSALEAGKTKTLTIR